MHFKCPSSASTHTKSDRDIHEFKAQWFANEMFEAVCICFFNYHWVKIACPKSILTLQLSVPQNTTGRRG